MEFKIGERVYSKSRNNYGVIVDKLSSATRVDYVVYVLRMDGSSYPVQVLGDDLESDMGRFEFEVKLEDGVAVAVMYEVRADGSRVELARSHGHLLNRTAVGAAQAASYALKRVFTSMNGGNVYLNNEEDNYE